MESKEITERLAQFVVKTRYSDIPPKVAEFTKQLTLKTVAGMVAGSVMPSGKKFAKIIRDRKLPEDVTAVGCNIRTSLWEAVLLDAFLAHASELEDDKLEGGEAWDITVIPLLLPLAQKLRLSGKSLMEALVVGLEVHVRTCLFSPSHLGIGMFPGAIGPAAGAARALSLDVEETASAMGLATSAVPLAFVNFGTDAHYLESALQSLQGIIAAEMAKEGMSSNPDIGTYLSGIIGKDRVVPDRMVADLGEQWLLQEIWIKKYPCCFINHRQLDTLLELRKRHNLSYEEVKTVEVHATPSDEQCNRPEPKTEGDLQFSLQHTLGSALLDGEINFDHFRSRLITDPRYREARSKINVIVHPDRPKAYMGEPRSLTIKTRDGREFSGQRLHAIGSPKEPLTTEQIKELYAKFTKGILSGEQIQKSAEVILGLESLKDIDGLIAILATGR